MCFLKWTKLVNCFKLFNKHMMKLIDWFFQTTDWKILTMGLKRKLDHLKRNWEKQKVILKTGKRFQKCLLQVWYSQLHKLWKSWEKVHYLVETVDKLSKGKSNFENVIASQRCVFGKAGLGFNPQHKQDRFSKSFLRKSEKQPIVKTKQPVVTCFYCMKKGHSVRFCKMRIYYVPKGFMKWIPKGCDVSNSKKKSQMDPNL